MQPRTLQRPAVPPAEQERLEAVERLAGATAHDLNNLLTVAVSVSRMLRDRLQGDAAALALLGDLEASTGRATQLVRRLAEAAAPPEATPAPPALAVAPGAAAAARTGARVLLVEDDQLVRTGMERALRAGGHAVYGAPGLALAMAVVESGADLDLLVTDVTMPGSDGPAVAAAVRALRPGLPVLFVTGHLPDAGALPGAVLGKPFTPSALREAVDAVLSGA